MGRICYGPSLSWAEFDVGRVVQLPTINVSLELSDVFYPNIPEVTVRRIRVGEKRHK